jgi:hypothetical protein
VKCHLLTTTATRSKDGQSKQENLGRRLPFLLIDKFNTDWPDETKVDAAGPSAGRTMGRYNVSCSRNDNKRKEGSFPFHPGCETAPLHSSAQMHLNDLELGTMGLIAICSAVSTAKLCPQPRKVQNPTMTSTSLPAFETKNMSRPICDPALLSLVFHPNRSTDPQQLHRLRKRHRGVLATRCKHAEKAAGHF